MCNFIKPILLFKLNSNVIEKKKNYVGWGKMLNERKERASKRKKKDKKKRKPDRRIKKQIIQRIF